MTTETKPSGLARKMAAAMAEIGRVEKRGKNQAQDYKYARADDVAEAARAALAKLGIALFADVLEDSLREIVIPSVKEGFPGKTLRVSRVKVAWTFVDSDTGESRTVHTPGEGMDSGDKGVYKAMTGAMKYALMLGFLIPTGDADPEKTSDADATAYGKPQDAPAAKSNAEKVKAKVAAANGHDSMPATPDLRKAALKQRMEALKIKGPDLAAKLGEWLGRPVDGKTVISEQDWNTVTAEIEKAKAATLALARTNMEAAGLGGAA